MTNHDYFAIAISHQNYTNYKSKQTCRHCQSTAESNVWIDKYHLLR